MILNEHPDALERLVPRGADATVKQAIKAGKAASALKVASAAGTELTIDLRKARVGGGWGWAAQPSVVAHWTGGIVVNFSRPHAVSGRFVMDAGDVNLTFKRYLESRVTLTIEDD
jgi:2,5-dihydroxypyridine 5,6-dioxygenase